MIGWFLSLEPGERLNELESRVAFLLPYVTMATPSFRRILELLDEHDVEDVVGSASRMAVGDLTIRVLPLQALIEEKKALGRDKDLAVVRLLEAVLQRRRASE